MDISSGFPNLSLTAVTTALTNSRKIPPQIINLILTHLSSPCTPSSTFPTLETLIEHNENLPWRNSSRSVPMGLGISPILFVYTLYYFFSSSGLQSSRLQERWYADDISLFFDLP